MNLEELINKLREADKAYYDDNKPIMPDHEYDGLVEEYFKLTETKWMTFESGGTIQHNRPMLSLNKAHTLEEVYKQLGTDTECVLMPKIDGGGLSLWYSPEGDLIRAVTRGKLVAGISYGEDVTANARMIKGIPLKVDTEGGSLEVRGEVYMTQSDLELANQLRKEPFRNTRNAATGILRKDSDVTNLKYVRFVAYNVFDPTRPHHEDMKFYSFKNQLEWLTKNSFKVPDTRTTTTANLELEDFNENVCKLQEYGTDGVVVMINDMSLQRSMGYSSRYPEFAIAFKFKTETAETTIRKIEWTATRTGRVVPTAIFDEVELDDTNVSRATLHNAKNVADLNIAIGDIVEVFKANMIIPQVSKIVTPNPNREIYYDNPFVCGGPTYYIPKQCPSCNSQLSWNDTYVDIVCTNFKCPPKLVGALTNAAGKKNWDIDGLGESVAEALAETMVGDLADLFELKDYEEALSLIKLSGSIRFGESRTRTLLDQIEKAKSKPWHVTLHALGCPGLGEPECKLIAQQYSLIDLINNSTEEDFVTDLVSIKGIGKKTAETFKQWLLDNSEWLLRLELQGLNTSKEEVKQASGILVDKTLCITGTHSVPRSVLEQLITDHGGTLTSSVSKKLGYLVAGENAGSKLDKATKLGVTILTEDELRCLIQET